MGCVLGFQKKQICQVKPASCQTIDGTEIAAEARDKLLETIMVKLATEFVEGQLETGGPMFARRNVLLKEKNLKVVVRGTLKKMKAASPKKAKEQIVKAEPSAKDKGTVAMKRPAAATTDKAQAASPKRTKSWARRVRRQLPRSRKPP